MSDLEKNDQDQEKEKDKDQEPDGQPQPDDNSPVTLTPRKQLKKDADLLLTPQKPIGAFGLSPSSTFNLSPYITPKKSGPSKALLSAVGGVGVIGAVGDGRPQKTGGKASAGSGAGKGVAVVRGVADKGPVGGGAIGGERAGGGSAAVGGEAVGGGAISTQATSGARPYWERNPGEKMKWDLGASDSEGTQSATPPPKRSLSRLPRPKGGSHMLDFFNKPSEQAKQSKEEQEREGENEDAAGELVGGGVRLPGDGGVPLGSEASPEHPQAEPAAEVGAAEGVAKQRSNDPEHGSSNASPQKPPGAPANKLDRKVFPKLHEAAKKSQHTSGKPRRNPSNPSDNSGKKPTSSNEPKAKENTNTLANTHDGYTTKKAKKKKSRGAGGGNTQAAASSNRQAGGGGRQARQAAATGGKSTVADPTNIFNVLKRDAKA